MTNQLAISDEKLWLQWAEGKQEWKWRWLDRLVIGGVSNSPAPQIFFNCFHHNILCVDRENHLWQAHQCSTHNGWCTTVCVHNLVYGGREGHFFDDPLHSIAERWGSATLVRRPSAFNCCRAVRVSDPRRSWSTAESATLVRRPSAFNCWAVRVSDPLHSWSTDNRWAVRVTDPLRSSTAELWCSPYYLP